MAGECGSAARALIRGADVGPVIRTAPHPQTIILASNQPALTIGDFVPHRAASSPDHRQLASDASRLSHFSGRSTDERGYRRPSYDPASTSSETSPRAPRTPRHLAMEQNQLTPASRRLARRWSGSGSASPSGMPFGQDAGFAQADARFPHKLNMARPSGQASRLVGLSSTGRAGTTCDHRWSRGSPL